jgi:hypothetical protein
MARLSPEKLALLKKAFTEDAMAPGQAAEAIGVTYGTAKRWYDNSRPRSELLQPLPEIEARYLIAQLLVEFDHFLVLDADIAIHEF